VKFLIDNQLPTTLAVYLRKKGVDCQRVLDVGLSKASDVDVCRYAAAQNCTIISKDEDFFYLASNQKAQFQLIWVRLGNCRTAALLSAFEQVWPKLETSLKAGERIIEIR